MTHTSGLRPDLDLGDPWTGSDTAIELAIEEVPTAPPGERFVYSDINYFLLGDIVRRVSGEPLDEFAQDAHLRAARHEGHDVPAAGVAAAAHRADREVHAVRLAVRRARTLQMLRGVVHDPTARRMGGVAGHAGLFSTAADLVALLPDAARRRRATTARASCRR